MAKKFAAEKHYQKSLGQLPPLPNQSNQSSNGNNVVSDPLRSLGSNQQDSALSLCSHTLSKLDAHEQLEVISNLLTKYMSNYSNQDVPVDFLCAAVCYLKNVI